MELTKKNAKVQLWPVKHEVSCGRITRSTWRAVLTFEGDTGDTIHPDAIRCEHTHGHKTTAAGAKCGYAMLKRLPS
jgi:hypothetical protein